MKAPDILLLRLQNQALARARFRSPEEVVAWFGAVQAQDYLGALWALGQRMRRSNETLVEAAERRRAIVRTWPMRGTLHFVAADDVRWMTRLLAPRVMARNAARLKKEVDVDARLLARSAEVLARALEGGRRLERADLYDALEARRIATGGSRGLHILVWLAMQGTLCHAGRQGKQQTFALLDEWIPKSRMLDGEEALVELALRYFRSHGPATQKDFMWWSGITAKQAAAALDGAKLRLAQVHIDGQEYWWQDEHSAAARPSVRTPQVRLLPAFDEFTVAYHDRSALAETAASKMSLLSPAVLIDGRVAGSWSRKLDRQAVTIRTSLHRKLSRAEQTALALAAQRYGEFLGVSATLPS